MASTLLLPIPSPNLKATLAPRLLRWRQHLRSLKTLATLAPAFTDCNEIESTIPKEELLACPVCFEPLLRKGPIGMKQRWKSYNKKRRLPPWRILHKDKKTQLHIRSAIARSAFRCNRCKKAFSSRDVFLDLTVTAGLKEYEEVLPAGIELFRNPLVSFIYERGWRQNFSRSGFPGPDEEVRLAQEFFTPTAGGVLVDVSCGSGLFSRRFAKSDAYSTIIALDFSENMLRQTHALIKQDQALDGRNLALVRADVARLPFATGTIDAVHAGAALHCWPSPSAGVAEISRILRPGGVFVATTFLSPITDLNVGALKPFQQAFRRATSSSSLRYWLEAELEDLCTTCGLTNYKKIRKRNFIMLCATKPST